MTIAHKKITREGAHDWTVRVIVYAISLTTALSWLEWGWRAFVWLGVGAFGLAVAGVWLVVSWTNLSRLARVIRDDWDGIPNAGYWPTPSSGKPTEGGE